jgi:hypothetical protein
VNTIYATQRELLAECDSITATLGWIGLFRNPAALGNGFDPLSLVEANYAGYARISVATTFPAASVDFQGNAASEAPLVVFTKSVGASNPQIFGFFMTDYTGSFIKFACLLDGGPAPMVNTTDIIGIRPRIAVGSPLIEE